MFSSISINIQQLLKAISHSMVLGIFGNFFRVHNELNEEKKCNWVVV